MKPKIRNSVGIVKIENGIVEIFKGNIRKSFFYKIRDKVIDIILSLDGTLTLEEISIKYDLDSTSFDLLKKLIFNLESKGIIIDNSYIDLNKDKEIYHRIISMLEDYSTNIDDIYKAWNNICNSKVLLIGLGGVGSWISLNLVQSGVKNIVLMDNDIIDISNLHRQWGYTEEDIKKYKTEVLKNRLLQINSMANIEIINEYLDEKILYKLNLNDVDLVINCADFPNVDVTSEIISLYCMKNSINHIIAGGYNKHISLIGQTILPFKTACYKCFDIQLKEKYNIKIKNIKKLMIPNRKIGSLGPMCTISASLTSMDAIKTLSKLIPPSNINRRGEFDIYTMNIEYLKFEKLENCPWCGRNGIYKK